MSIEQGIELMEKYENLSFNKNSFSSNIYQDSDKTKIGNNFVSAVAVNSLECLPNRFNSVYVDQKLKTDNSSIPFSYFYPIGLELPFDHIVNQIFVKTSREWVKGQVKKG